ncbi:MAG: lamin tail domain-containing protein, partial [Planctomycetota bacterium]
MPHAFALLLLLQGPSTAPVVVNEFAYDDQGTDTVEFVELYNRSGAPVDISGWTVDCGDTTVCAGVCATPGCLAANNNPDTVIPAATILPAGGYWLIGPATLPGVNQVGSFLENDREWIVLRDAASAIVDAVAYETNIADACFPPTNQEGPGIHGNNVMIEGSAAPYGAQNLSVSRVLNGYDSDNNGTDFALLPWT